MSRILFFLKKKNLKQEYTDHVLISVHQYCPMLMQCNATTSSGYLGINRWSMKSCSCLLVIVWKTPGIILCGLRADVCMLELVSIIEDVKVNTGIFCSEVKSHIGKIKSHSCTRPDLFLSCVFSFVNCKCHETFTVCHQRLGKHWKWFWK